jgi:aldehyde dehydrogenase (NAD+)
MEIAVRKKCLLILKNLLNNEKNKICDALKKDLHKPNFESYYLEINSVEHELQYHIDNFENWINEEIFINPFRYLTIFLTGYARATIENKPRGNCLIIGAWNYPIELSLKPLIGSISAGNNTTIVFPDLDYTENTTNLMVNLFTEYFKNIDNINVKIGGKDNVTKILETKWDFIFYTGSQNVGKIIYKKAAEKLTPILLELGGKSPCIVEKQYNMDLMIKRMIWGKFANCGQTCVSPDYFLVNENIGDDFIELVKKNIIEFYGNNIFENDDYGRIVNINAQNRIVNIIKSDKKYIVYGGNYNNDKLFIEPTIINFKTNKTEFINSKCMENELFGPIIPVYYFKSYEEVNEIIKLNNEPLVCYIFSKRKDILSKDIRSGSIVYNDTLMQMASPLPFGGIGNSGNGKYHGKSTFDIFSYQRSILTRYNFGELILSRFPPYNIYWKKFILKISQKVISFNLFNRIKWLFIFVPIFYYYKIKK